MCFLLHKLHFSVHFLSFLQKLCRWTHLTISLEINRFQIIEHFGDQLCRLSCFSWFNFHHSTDNRFLLNLNLACIFRLVIAEKKDERVSVSCLYRFVKNQLKVVWMFIRFELKINSQISKNLSKFEENWRNIWVLLNSVDQWFPNYGPRHSNVPSEIYSWIKISKLL